MTQRFSGFQVTLADDIREDDAEHIINAFRMIKGVINVRPIEASYCSPEVTRCRIELSKQLTQLSIDVLSKEPVGRGK